MGAELRLLEYLRGTRSNPNSSNTALAGDAVFTGSWVVNNYPHMGLNVKANPNRRQL